MHAIVVVVALAFNVLLLVPQPAGSAGFETLDALLTLTAQRRAGRSTHPFYWAGFVAAGDWR